MLKDESYRQQWEALCGTTYEAFEKKILTGMPADMDLSTEYFGGGFFNVKIASQQFDPENAASFLYSMTPGERCKIQGANVYKRGDNLASVITGNIMSILPQMGITQIELSAKEVGAYLWARAGFVPYATEWNKISSYMSKKLDYLASLPDNDISDATHKDLRKLFESSDPKSIWAFVDCQDMVGNEKLGKVLIMQWSEEYFPSSPQLTETSPDYLQDGIHWHGICRLNDPDCHERLSCYAKTAIKPEAGPSHLRISLPAKI